MLTAGVPPSGKRTEPHSNNEYGDLRAAQWRDLFIVRKEALSSIARVLTEGPCSPAVVLFNAESKIQDRDIPREFRYRYAIRTVVLAALVMPSLEECPDGFELFDSSSADLAEFEGRIAVLPRLERCVVFLRDVLGYSKRETGLLLGVGDVQVEDSHYSGRNRLILQGGIALERVKPYFDASSCSEGEAAMDGGLPGYPRLSGTCAPGHNEIRLIHA